MGSRVRRGCTPPRARGPPRGGSQALRRAHCRPDEVVRRAAEHNVGLALEEGATLNRDLCVTNKLSIYSLAGLPLATTGDRGVRVGLHRAAELQRVWGRNRAGERDLPIARTPGRRAAAAYRVGNRRGSTGTLKRVVFLDIVAETMGRKNKGDQSSYPHTTAPPSGARPGSRQ